MTGGDSVLVDTHILLWMRITPETLTNDERCVLDQASRRLVSVVSLWEIAILMGLGRIADEPRLLAPPAHFDMLPIQPAHCAAFARLPRLHKDPFDRMLIAQPASEAVPLLTRDARIGEYAEFVRLAGAFE